MAERRHYIGEIAKSLGISPNTIRWYEAQGLLPEPVRTASGYRAYTAEHLERLQFIRKAFGFGFSSKEIRQILELRAHGSAPCELVIELIKGKISDVERQIQDLQHLKRELTELRSQWQAERKSGRAAPARICCFIEETEQPKLRRSHA